MSGLFRSAAYALLSKTLQTLLSKFLEDVTLEGVALPSLMGSSGPSGDEDHPSDQGWGVRLSNVKLRSGTVLPVPLAPLQRKEEDEQPKQRKKPSKTKKGHRRKDQNKEGSKSPVKDTQDQSEQQQPSSLETTTTATATTLPLETKPDTLEQQTSQPSQTPTQRPKDQVLHPQQRSSWLFGSWYSSSNVGNEPKVDHQMEMKQEAQPNDSHTNNGDTDTLEKKDTEKTEQQQQQPATNKDGNHHDSTTAATSQDAPEEDGHDSDNDDDDDEDEPPVAAATSSPPVPMEMRLGPNGCIGTLDIRIVGRDVHVLVEDADLTVEIVPHNDDNDDNNNNNNNNTTPDHKTTTTETDDQQQQPPTTEAQDDNQQEAVKDNNKKSPDKPEPKTTGDRILAENPLARILSMLPNLLLRDIRIQLVMVQPKRRKKKRKPQHDAATTAATAATATTTEDVMMMSGGAAEEKKLDAPSAPAPDHDDTNPPNDNNTNNTSIVQVCIELLSITDGHDFFAHFRHDPNTMHADHIRNADSIDDDDSSVDSQEAAQRQQQQQQRLTKSHSGGSHVQSSDDEDDDLDYDDENLEEALSEMPQNEYLQKRIRTGRGADGGIVVRILPPPQHPNNLFSTPDDDGALPPWPRQRWNDSIDHGCFLRCSGLDVQARVFLGTKAELELQNQSSSWYYSSTQQVESSSDYNNNGKNYDADFDGFAVDSMLFGGVDYIVPGPQQHDVSTSAKTLPPISEGDDDNENNDNKDEVENTPILWELPGATTYQLDANGIQSSWVDTSFHRIARGWKPSVSRGDGSSSSKHPLPCEYSSDTWQYVVPPPSSSSDTNTKTDTVPVKEHLLDAAAPMGGLVLHLSMRDVLEVNADRASLNVIGLAASLFRRPKKKSNDSLVEKSSTEASDDNPHSDENQQKEKDTGDSPSNGSVPDETSGDAQTSKEGDVAQAFPTYMQPEKIQYIGVHIGEVRLRVHLMRPEERSGASHYSFAYLDTCLKCLTADVQKLNCSEKQFQDVRVDVGHLTATEFRGVEEHQLCSAGLRQRVIDFDEVTVETLMTRDDDCQRPPWPSTAAVLLDIPPPLETLVYETRERHAVQLRFISLNEPHPNANAQSNNEPNRTQSMIHAKLGAASIEIPRNIGVLAKTTIAEAKACIVPPAASPQSPKKRDKAESKKRNSRVHYRIDLDGARVQVQNTISVRLPFSTFTGEVSSAAGFSIESMIDHLDVAYGKKEELPMLMSDKRLPLGAFVGLSEPLKLRILFFLDDLNPLARAVGLSSSDGAGDTSFLNHKAILKQLDKIARRQVKLTRNKPTTLSKKLSNTDGSTSGENRRQTILTELLRLSDEQLEQLYESHLRSERRKQKHRSSRSSS